MTNIPNGGLFSSAYGNKVRIACCIPRPTISGGSITWALVDDVDHDISFFTGVSTPASTTLRISYPTVSRVLGFWANPDETMVKYGLSIGMSVGLSYADLFIYSPYQTRQLFTYSGGVWVNSAGVNFATLAISGVSTTITTAVTGTADRDDQVGHVPVAYAGTNNRYVREVYSGLSYNQSKFDLVDPTTGTSTAPSAGDKVMLTNPSVLQPVQTTAPGISVAKQAFESANANFWVGGVFVL
jgi:hypothetical protein